MNAICQGEFSNSGLKWSGKVKNPGKRWSLMCAAECVRELNECTDKEGRNWARKAMIGCGLSLEDDGIWKTEQLFPHLQDIVEAYPDHFGGVKSADQE